MTFFLQSRNSHYEEIVKVLEEERDHYKREYEILRSKHSSATRLRASKLEDEVNKVNFCTGL